MLDYFNHFHSANSNAKFAVIFTILANIRSDLVLFFNFFRFSHFHFVNAIFSPFDQFLREALNYEKIIWENMWYLFKVDLVVLDWLNTYLTLLLLES